MLRTMWMVLTSLALANLIGLGAFCVWLKASDRISTERVHALRAMFTKTITEEMQAQASEEAARRALDRQVAETGRVGRVPLSAEDRVAVIREYEELTREMQQRLQRETQDLRDALAQERAILAQERAAFVAMRDAFEKRRKEIEALEGSDQFQRAVKVYESVRSDAARSMLQALLDEGEEDQVVAYLNAMKPATATKIVTEFQATDPKLAAKLLEGIRMHGLAVASTPAPE